MGLLFRGVVFVGLAQLEAAKIDDETIGVAAGVELLVHGMVAVEQELTDVSEGHRIGAGDALAGELHGDIAKENVDVEDRGEVVDAVEKVGGDDVVVGLGAFGARAGMVGAERRVAFGAEHAAAAAGMSDVMAEQLLGRLGLGRLGSYEFRFLGWPIFAGRWWTAQDWLWRLQLAGTAERVRGPGRGALLRRFRREPPAPYGLCNSVNPLELFPLSAIV